MASVARKLRLLCCDQPEALRIRPTVPFPVTLLVEAAEDEEGPITDETLAHSSAIPLAGATLRVDSDQREEVQAIVDKLADFPDAIEPFERIRQAIQEAQSQIARAQAPLRCLIMAEQRPRLGKDSSMWRHRQPHGIGPAHSIAVEIDEANSWSVDDLTTADTYEN